jgi:hypothetical protein
VFKISVPLFTFAVVVELELEEDVVGAVYQPPHPHQPLHPDDPQLLPPLVTTA